jgi:hypothetical protein
MTLQQLLLQRIGDKEAVFLQFLEDLKEIIQEPEFVGPLQNTKRSREGEIPAQCDSASSLVIDQEHVRAQTFRQQNGLAFASVQSTGNRIAVVSCTARTSNQTGSDKTRRRTISGVLGSVNSS